MNNQYITVVDFLVLPMLLLVIYGYAYKYRNKHYSRKDPLFKYFIPGLTVKIFGAIFISLIYVYYYDGGDTTRYFLESKKINSALDESVVKWLNLVFRIPGASDVNYYNYLSQILWYSDPGSYAVCSITAVISLFTLKTFLPTAVLFAALSFTGIWALFRTFVKIYPRLIQPIAIAVLFIPSTFVWGSGIFKDTVCMFGLGWMTYSVFRILVERNFSVSNLVLTASCLVLVATVKVYILLAFLPALGLWILSIYTSRIRSKAVRFVTMLVVFALVGAGSVVLMGNLGEDVLGRYSLENIEYTANVTRAWIEYSSIKDEGSPYSLGDFDPSITGMLSKFPLAVNVTLFRPYIWEARKVIVLLSAAESIIFLFLTLRLFFSVGIKQIFRTISTDPTIQFCLVFSIIFAFAVGITSYNFGALSRYKIPCLPFYLLFVILTFYKNNPSNKKLFPLLRL